MEQTMIQRARALAAFAAMVSLGACSGGGSSTPARVLPPTVQSTVRIVGIGDSLTAGVQSQGLMGADVAPNPIPGSPYPYIQATQPHGFWALLWSQMNAGADPGNPTISPLPLIAPPGIGQILVPTASGGLTSITTRCGSQNALAFSSSTALSTRLNPGTTPFDVAVPGETFHEGLFQIQPTTPCVAPPGPIGALSGVVFPESDNILPILSNFGPNVTQLQAAIALKPTITTVWLGSNDLLKFVFTGGAIIPTDPASMGADATSMIRQLNAAGSKVAIANLVDVLTAATFLPQPFIGPVITQRLVGAGLPAAVAAGTAAQVVAGLQTQYGVGPGGYITISGLSNILGALAMGQPFTLAPAGDYVPDALAAQTQALNDAYNAAIAAAASSTGATLVDVHGFVKTAYMAGGIPINPPKCCNFQYGGGFYSLDGIHPSNTGYATIANIFIDTMNKAFGTSTPDVNVAAIYATDIYAPH